jgi:hypothetical protein
MRRSLSRRLGGFVLNSFVSLPYAFFLWAAKPDACWCPVSVLSISVANFFMKLADFLLLGDGRSYRTGHGNLKLSFLCSLPLLIASCLTFPC